MEDYRSSHDISIKYWTETDENGDPVEKMDASAWDQFNDIRTKIAILDAEAEFSLRRMEKINRVTRMQTFDNYSIQSSWQGAIFDIARQYADDPSGWFYIGGQTGCGKTHLCMAICRKLSDKGERIRVSTWKEDSRILRDMSRENGYKRDNLLFYLKEAATLCIDDFLRGHPTEAERNICFEIIDHRYRTGKRTIISSEYTLQRLIEVYDEAIGGRIAEMCGKNVVTIGGDSRKNFRTSGGNSGGF